MGRNFGAELSHIPFAECKPASICTSRVNGQAEAEYRNLGKFKKIPRPESQTWDEGCTNLQLLQEIDYLLGSGAVSGAAGDGGGAPGR